MLISTLKFMIMLFSTLMFMRQHIISSLMFMPVVPAILTRN